MRRKDRYLAKRMHKLKLQKKYMKRYDWGRTQNLKLFQDHLIEEASKDSWWLRKHPPRNHGWEYWKTCYYSGRRKVAKEGTNRRIRQKYRQMISNMDPEDVTAPSGSDYEKEYDYFWTIW